MTSAPLDFGYPWWLSYGHLIVLVPTAALVSVGLMRHWARWPMLVLGLLLAWSSAALCVTRLMFNPNGIPALPTSRFLEGGTGRVLDIGAGTGRSSIMVLLARPKATLVASDLFGESFDRHFGHGQTPQQRLLANLKAAGVEQRTSIETADMRQLPFGSATFDALVSAYAMDHLNRQGITQSLSEANRVVKPGGDFLLILVANDRWAKLAFGPLLAHGGTRAAAWWTDRLQEAGFQVLDHGTQPLTLYLLARRPQ